MKKNTTLGKAKKVTLILFIFELLSLNAYSDSAKIKDNLKNTLKNNIWQLR